MDEPIMINSTPARRRAYYRRKLEVLADRLGASTEAADDLVRLLPYSTIPDVSDAVEILDFLEGLGWRRTDG